MHYLKEKRCLGLAVIILFFQGILVLIVGIISDANTLLIEAFKSLSGFITAFMLYKNISLLYQPADENYNFGYYKIEPLIVFKQSTFLIAGSILAIFFAIQDIVNADRITHEKSIIISVSFSLVTYLFLWLYFYLVNRKIKSGVIEILVTRWVHGIVEYVGITSCFMFIYFMEKSGNRSFHSISAVIDPIMTIILGVVTIIMPIRHYMKGYRDLMDRNPGKEYTLKILNWAQESAKIFFKEPLETTVKIRTAGEKTFITLCFSFEPGIKTGNISDYFRALDNQLKKETIGTVFIDYCIRQP